MLQKKIKTLRELRGLTQQQLADKVFITQQALSQYENGKRNCDLSTFELILDALNVETLFTNKTVKGEGKMNIFHKAAELEEKHPTWNVFHSGGGIFILYKDIYSKTLDKEIMVMITEDAGIVSQDLENNKVVKDVYITSEQYQTLNDEKDYDGYAYECQKLILSYREKGIEKTEYGLELFDEETLDDIIKVMQNM